MTISPARKPEQVSVRVAPTVTLAGVRVQDGKAARPRMMRPDETVKKVMPTLLESRPASLSLLSGSAVDLTA